jgi:hypothetical protein
MVVMASGSKIKGLNQVIRNLNRRIDTIPGKTLKGIIRGVAHIRRDMDKTAPLIPVDKGNLRASFFVVTSDGVTTQGANPNFKQIGKKTTFTARQMARLETVHAGTIAEMTAKAKALGTSKGPFVVFGFGAYYALYVHEMTTSSGISSRALSHMGAVSKRGQSGINWTRPGSGPKFLENAVDRNTAMVLYLVAKEAQGALR